MVRPRIGSSRLPTASLGLLVLVQAYLAGAQQLLVYGDDALPACAQQCPVLSQAQAACVPPAAPVTDQATYESCFCQSGYLTQLKSDPSALCGSVCTAASDLSQIQQWYAQNCVNDGSNAAAQVTTVVITTTSAGLTGGPTTTGTITGSATASTETTSPSNDSSSSSASPSW